jgi:hypothetical protein
VLSDKELSQLGMLRPILTNASQTERRIFDYRNARSPRELDPWILKTLHDPKLEYTLLRVGTPSEVNRFRSELRDYAQSRYRAGLPENFQVVGVDSPDLLTSALQKRISAKNTPAGIISEERRLLEEIGYRGRFTVLRSLGDSESPEIHNATGLLTEAWLLKENLPLEIRAEIQTGRDLDLNKEWDGRVAALRAQAALSSAA